MWDQVTFDRICARIDELEPDMVELQKRLVPLEAISPKSGGTGEKAKVDFLRPMLEGWGLEVTEYRAPDKDAPCGYRPSLVARLRGEQASPCRWIMTHLDVVPAGPRELWSSDPFTARVENGRVYGRGTEDNQQEMVASIYAVRAMLGLRLKPKTDVCLMLVADEETGSEFGADWLLSNHELCGHDDLVVVADAGDAQGTMMEVAEKSILWARFRVTGKQTHGSTPGSGRNAHRAAAKLVLRLDDELHRKYDARDELFSPPESTFEPTKREANVPNVNTIPGEDVFWFDCRVLPQYPVEEVLELMRRVAAGLAAAEGVDVAVETGQFAQAPEPTPADSPVVKMLDRAVRAVWKVEPKPMGIGGGTVAAFFRRKGIPAVVWGKYDGRAHNPDEYCVIANMVGDAKVYAHLFGQ